MPELWSTFDASSEVRQFAASLLPSQSIAGRARPGKEGGEVAPNRAVAPAAAVVPAVTPATRVAKGSGRGAGLESRPRVGLVIHIPFDEFNRIPKVGLGLGLGLG